MKTNFSKQIIWYYKISFRFVPVFICRQLFLLIFLPKKELMRLQRFHHLFSSFSLQSVGRSSISHHSLQSFVFRQFFLDSILRRCQSICCLIFVNDFLWLIVDRSIFVQRTSIEWKHLSFFFWKLSKQVNTIKLKIGLMIWLQDVTVIGFKRKLSMSRNKKFILVGVFVARIH